MKLIKLSTAILLALITSYVYPGSYQGKVSNVFAYSDKVFVFVSEGFYDDPNTCTDRTDRLSLWIDPATDYGKALLSISLTAKTTGRLVWAGGSNSCIAGPGGNSEQLTTIDLKG